jgi:hypothetical protein
LFLKRQHSVRYSVKEKLHFGSPLAITEKENAYPHDWREVLPPVSSLFGINFPRACQKAKCSFSRNPQNRGKAGRGWKKDDPVLSERKSVIVLRTRLMGVGGALAALCYAALPPFYFLIKREIWNRIEAKISSATSPIFLDIYIIKIVLLKYG